MPHSAARSSRSKHARRLVSTSAESHDPPRISRSHMLSLLSSQQHLIHFKPKDKKAHSWYKWY
eukprot:406898-Rhodomonas_salina.1